MNVLVSHTTVIPMLIVPTPWGHTTVHASLDGEVMDFSVKVI